MAEQVADEALLESWRAGEKSAGETLFRRHFKSIYDFFRWKVGLEHVEEVAQRTFLGLLEALERFRGDASVRTYLFAIAYNVLREHIRAGRRNGLVDFATQSLQDLDPSPSQVLAVKEEKRQVLEALRLISVEQRIAIELRYYEDLTIPEIAQILEVPAGTVSSRLRLGLQHLQAHLAGFSIAGEALKLVLSGLY